MEPESAQEEFIRYVEASGKRRDALSISEAVDLMLGFYAEMQPKEVLLDYEMAC
jgi:hypothetical protein